MSTNLSTVFGENLMDVFDGFDRNFFRDFGNVDRALYGKNAQRMMKTDVKETDEGYEVDVDLPGFKKDEINLELNDGYLSVTAAKGLDKDEEKDGHYIRRERYAGSCSRSFYIGDAIESKDISAKFEDGILRICLPKQAPKQIPAKSSIAIE